MEIFCVGWYFIPIRRSKEHINNKRSDLLLQIKKIKEGSVVPPAIHLLFCILNFTTYI